MNDEPLLTLHCPECAKLVDVITEGANLVCLDCGHTFNEAIAAKLLGVPQPLLGTSSASPMAAPLR